jgi:hypothetical protein
MSDLDEILRDAVTAEGCTLDEMTVLGKDKDPYRSNTPAKMRDAKWVGEQVARFAPNRRIHIRGLHYLIVAAGNVKKPNGEVYCNTEKDYDDFLNPACCWARWLGVVPIPQIVDQRNDEPWTPPEQEIEEPDADLTHGAKVEVPDADDLMPSFTATGFVARQPYHLVMIGEKSSLREDLLPLAKEFGAELILLTGENSITRIHEMLIRAEKDGRPTRAFYFSDFDPSGWNMAVATARKIQALRDQYFEDLDLVLYRVALTEDLVHEHNLPSTPLKEKDVKAPAWRDRFGRDATEIDALIALYPDVLERLARDALSPFFDAELSGSVEEAAKEWQEAADQAIEEHPDYDAVVARIEAARNAVVAVVEQLAVAQRIAHETLSDLDPPDIEVPEAETDDDTDCPLIFNTATEFVEATQLLRTIKNYEE